MKQDAGEKQVVNVGSALRHVQDTVTRRPVTCRCARKPGQTDVVVDHEGAVIDFEEQILSAVIVVEKLCVTRAPWAIQSSQIPRVVR